MNSGIFDRHDNPDLFDRVSRFKQYWQGDVFYLISAGRDRVRFWSFDHPDLPAFAGKNPHAPIVVREKYQAAALEKASAERAKVDESRRRQKVTGCPEFIGKDAYGRFVIYCARCGFDRESHS